MGGTSGDLLAELAILVLAGFVGFAVISKVPNTLHTPLMSGTNAIHGIVLLGGIVVLGRLENPSPLDAVVLVVAIVFGMINVVGGFLVTDRMLGMFKPERSVHAHRGRPAVTVVVPLLYIVAFALFILGLSGLTGPRTAVRGNKIAAVGMLVAVLATLLTVRHNWLLILAGLVVGAALGVPSARRVRMTAMPQMVALFNGVGGGAVALIAWSEFRTTDAFAGEPLYVVIASLFGAIVGSVSFWGSLVAFGKLQEILPGRPLGLGRAQQAVNLLLLAGAAACAASAAIGGAEPWMVGLLVFAAALGVMVVLPIGGADMPVVISLLNASTGLSAAAIGLALGNTAMIVAGMIVGASGTILTNLMATAMNRSIPAIVAGGFGGTATAPGADGGADRHVTAPPRPPTRRSEWPTPRE